MLDTVHADPHRRRWVALGLCASLLAALAICEWQGWPMLRKPTERWLGQRLARSISFDENGGAAAWRLRLLGGIRLNAGHLEVGGPAWSFEQPTLLAKNASLQLRYSDLWKLSRGQVLRIKSLQADTLDLRIERRLDGRASWQFGESRDASAANADPAFAGVEFEYLAVRDGSALVDDKLGRLALKASFALREANAGANDQLGLQAKAEGSYRDMPLKASLSTGSALPWLSADPKSPAVPVTLQLDLGRAGLNFDGQVQDLLKQQGLSGRYKVRGPSLAAVGEPLGLTLPTTGAFAMQGSLTRNGTRWSTAVSQATVGRSRLAGDFVFDTPPSTLPTLSGELRGTVLWLADLGPAIGVPTEAQPPAQRKPERVLPDRQFDLPSLRAMNADVQVKLNRLESGSDLLQAVEPLNARLRLQDGVLLLDEINARLAQGRLAGSVRLDGREAQAHWETKLRISGLLLEQWLKLQRTAGNPPYVTGRLGGRLDLTGHGRSSAELLATADGRAVLYWTRGSVSHLLVEAGGIDVAQALGVLIKGDNSLTVSCGAADLRLKQGRVTPDLLLVDTTDSIIKIDGSMSLATEQLDLVARVLPKDISPLALRTPLRIRGSLGDPDLSLEKGPLLRRLVPAALLATLNPLAALLPLIDLGDDDARQALGRCRDVLARQAPATVMR
jgi:uncharacterized protein involved in outer membrane biogenesis